jgi:hypothetical protein
MLQQSGDILKLQRVGITDDLWEALQKFQRAQLFNDFYLVGGTALSLQIGHRLSKDIDLFTPNEIDKAGILNFIQNNFKEKFDIMNNSESIFQIMIGETLKVDFVKYQYELLDPLIESEGVRLIGKNDISAMKISAVGTRGYEAKDYVDIYFLLREMPIGMMFDNFKRKYNTTDIQHYKRSVVYFDDVPESSWKGVQLIGKPISSHTIKKTLIKEVAKYSQFQGDNLTHS